MHPRTRERFGGLSPVVLDHIARVEDHPGSTVRDLREWRAIARQPRSVFPSWSDTGYCRVCGYYGHVPFCRDALEDVMMALPAFAARRLAALIGPIDAAVLARARVGAPEWRGAPWWHRHLERR